MNVEALEDTLREALDGEVRSSAPLDRLTTYRLGGPAGLLVEPVSEADLMALSELLPGDVPILVLGRGSNILISDRGWPGVVVHLPTRRFGSVTSPEDEPGIMNAGGATSLPVVANWAARRNLSGVEFMIAIPGSVGGAVRMNAGAHSGATADALVEVRVADLRAGSIVTRSRSDLGLGYRTSNLAASDVVIEATFELQQDEGERIRAKMETYRRHRAETQPPAVQNAGSTFKNPDGDHAGRLVEAAGLKGFRVGGASVSRLHANFFVTDDDATAQDVYELVRAVSERVLESSGVSLEPEVRFMGDFGPHP